MRRGTLGLHITPQLVSATLVERWPVHRIITATLQLDDIADPAVVVAWLQKHFDAPWRVALSFDMAWVSVKRLALPALSPLEQASVLRIEPARFFVAAEDSLIGMLPGGTAARMDAPAVQRWIDALSEWAPVENVEPAPLSYVRALAYHTQMRDARVLGCVDRGFWLATMQAGELADLRKSIGAIQEAARVIAAADDTSPVVLTGQAVAWQEELSGLLPHVRTLALPALRGARDEAVAALGSAVGLATLPGPETLLPSSTRERAIRRRRTGLAVAMVCFALSVTLLFAALGAARHRFEARIDARIAKLQPSATQTQRNLAEIRSIARLMESIARADAERTPTLQALSRLAEILPKDAQVSSIRIKADEWTIEGYTNSAAALVPLLENAPEFEGVQMRGAVTRIETQGITRERFAISLGWTDAH